MGNIKNKKDEESAKGVKGCVICGCEDLSKTHVVQSSVMDKILTKYDVTEIKPVNANKYISNIKEGETNYNLGNIKSSVIFQVKFLCGKCNNKMRSYFEKNEYKDYPFDKGENSYLKLQVDVDTNNRAKIVRKEESLSDFIKGYYADIYVKMFYIDFMMFLLTKLESEKSRKVDRNLTRGRIKRGESSEYYEGYDLNISDEDREYVINLLSKPMKFGSNFDGYKDITSALMLDTDKLYDKVRKHFFEKYCKSVVNSINKLIDDGSDFVFPYDLEQSVVRQDVEKLKSQSIIKTIYYIDCEEELNFFIKLSRVTKLSILADADIGTDKLKNVKYGLGIEDCDEDIMVLEFVTNTPLTDTIGIKETYWVFVETEDKRELDLDIEYGFKLLKKDYINKP